MPGHVRKPPQEHRKGFWHGHVIYDWGYYEGDWEDGRWHGHGVCHHEDDGRTYDGEFRNHRMHGKGKMTYPDGHVITGTWENVHSWTINQGHGEVRWTDGSLEQFEKLSIDRHHTLQKGKGRAVTEGKP